MIKNIPIEKVLFLDIETVPQVSNFAELSETEQKLWDKKTAYYTGFGEDGKSITNVSPQGVAAYQDYETDAAQSHALLGETTKSLKDRGVTFVPELLPDGTSMIVAKNRSGAVLHSTNIDQVLAAMNAFKAKWSNPNGEGYKYAKDAGLNITPDIDLIIL